MSRSRLVSCLSSRAPIYQAQGAAAAGDSKEQGGAAGAPGDELASFFSEVGGGGGAMSGANVQREMVKVVKEDYAKQDLGASSLLACVSIHAPTCGRLSELVYMG